jgi:hypothetical protein
LCASGPGFGQVSGGGTSPIDPQSFGYYQDALRFSDIGRGGTARFQGLAGSGSALGGDLSSSIINPAGLGFFNRSVISITPQFSFRDNNSSYLGSENVSFSNNFAIGQIGISIDLTKSDYEKGPFRGGSLAFSFNKRNDFNETVELVGENYSNSIVDYYVEQAQGIDVSNFYGNSQEVISPIGLGYDAFLFDIDINACPDPNEPCNQYERFYDFEPMRQREVLKTKGNQNEWNIAYGGNVMDKFYFGTKLGIATVNYTMERTYSELAIDQSTDALQNMTLNDRLEINGAGVNLGFGVIYRPLDVVRFGASIETPTYYNLEEKFEGSMTTQFNNFLFAEDPNDPDNNFYLNNQSSELLPGYFDYVLRTPLRVNFGTAIFAGKNGFITADVEYLDYRRSRVSFQSVLGDEGADNRSIKNIYDATFNYRIGGELRLNDFRFRGGYAYFGDPFQPNVNLIDQSRNRISGGFGMRLADFFWDLAVIHDWWNEGYTVYNLQSETSPAASINKALTSIALTGGIN